MNAEFKACVCKQQMLAGSSDAIQRTCVACGALFWVSNAVTNPGKWCCSCRVERRNARKRARRLLPVLEGFPRNKLFETREEMQEYLEGINNKIQCLECGHWFRAIGKHLRDRHGTDVRDYKRKYGIPFTGHGLINPEGKALHSTHAKEKIKNIPHEQLKKAQQACVEAIKGKSMDRFSAPYLEKETSQRAKDHPNKVLVNMKGETCTFPCSKCSVPFTTSVISAITASCKILCPECKRKSRREAAKKCYEKVKQDPVKWQRYLDRMRGYRANQTTGE